MSVYARQPMRLALRVHDLLWTKCARNSLSPLWSQRCHCFDRWPLKIDQSLEAPIECVLFLFGSKLADHQYMLFTMVSYTILEYTYVVNVVGLLLVYALIY